MLWDCKGGSSRELTPDDGVISKKGGRRRRTSAENVKSSWNPKESWNNWITGVNKAAEAVKR